MLYAGGEGERKSKRKGENVLRKADVTLKPVRVHTKVLLLTTTYSTSMYGTDSGRYVWYRTVRKVRP